MSLTPEQQATLKSFVEADQVLNAIPHTADGASAIAAALGATASPAWYVYRTDVSRSEVQDTILFANMTPAQSIPVNNTNEALQIWIAKALLAQGKQFNLQNLLINADTVNFALPNVRAGFQDSLSGLPTKSDGTNQAGGWNTLQNKISRPASIIEKLFSTGTGSQAVPATMGFEGTISSTEVAQAMAWNV